MMIRTSRSSKRDWPWTPCTAMAIVGDDIHLFGRSKPHHLHRVHLRLQHAVIDRASLTFKTPAADSGAQFYTTNNALYLTGPGRVVIFGVNDRGLGRVSEYSSSANRCTPCQWMLPFTLDMTTGVCCTRNGQFMLFFGGQPVGLCGQLSAVPGGWALSSRFDVQRAP